MSIWSGFVGDLKKAKDQLDPFDGGKTWSNPQPAPRAATPVMPSTPQSGGLSVAPANNPMLQISDGSNPATPSIDFSNHQAQPQITVAKPAAPVRIAQPAQQLGPVYSKPAPLPVTVAAPQNLKVGDINIAPDSGSATAAHSWNEAPAIQPPQNKAYQALEGAGHGIAKSFTSFADIVPMAVGQVKAITPKPLDHYIDAARHGTQTAVDAPLHGYESVLRDQGLIDANNKETTKQGQHFERGGGDVTNLAALANVPKDAVVAISKIPTAIKAGVETAKAVPTIIKGGVEAAKTIPKVAGDVARGGGDLVKGGRNQINRLLQAGKDTFGRDPEAAPKMPVPGEQPPSMIQSVNPATGEKKFYSPTSEEYPALKTQIDDARDGTAQAGVKDENGNVLHLTSGTPEKMKAAGFTQVDKYEDLSKPPEAAPVNIQAPATTPVAAPVVPPTPVDAGGFMSTPDQAMEKAIQTYMKQNGVDRASAETNVQRLLGESTRPGQTLDGGYGDLSAEQKAENAANNPLMNHVASTIPKVSEGDSSQAVLNARSVVDTTKELHNSAVESAAKLSKNDLKLLDSIRGADPAEVAKSAEDPEAFSEAADNIKHYNDYNQAAAHHLGLDVGYKKNYGAPLLFDMSDPEAAANVEKYKASLNTAPAYGKTRRFYNYDDAAQFGAKRLNSNIIEDLNQDAQRRMADLGRATLTKGLNEAHPGKISQGEILSGKDTGTYEQLKIPFGDHLAAPKDIAHDLNKRANAGASEGALAVYDRANAGLKYAKLGGGTFHSITTAGTVGGQQVASGAMFAHPVQNLKLIAGTLSKRAHLSNMKQFEADGTLANARVAGVTLRADQILGDANVKFIDKMKDSKLNFIKNVHDMVFDRQIPEAKLMIFKQQTAGLDANIPEDLSKMRKVASAVNNLGGINRAVEGTTPGQLKQLSRVVLATDFTEGKLRVLANAFTKFGADSPEGKIARQMVVGKSIVYGMPGLLAGIAAGKIDPSDPKSLGAGILGQTLNPEMPTGFKTASGIPKTAKTPESFISEIGRIVQPIFDKDQPDKLAGIKHYATARTAALPSTIVSAAENQDYFGNPVIAHGKDGSVDIVKSAENLATGNAPIPVAQGVKMYQKSQDPTNTQSIRNAASEALLNTAGLRVTADASDPRMKSMAYQQHVEGALTGKAKDAYDTIHGKAVDDNGNPLQTAMSDSMLKRYAQFVNQPDVLKSVMAADQKIQLYRAAHNLPVDPYYALSPDQQKTLLVITNRKTLDASDEQAKIMATNNKGWLDQFYTDRGKYFDSLNLPAGGNPDAADPIVQFPTASTGVQSKLDALSQISDATQKAQYMAANPDIADYYASYDKAVRSQHSYFNEPQYDAYPEADPKTQALMDQYDALPKGEGAGGKSPTRSAWIKANPGAWATITDQFSKTAQYNLQQDASRAQYEGQDLSDKGIKAIKSLAQDLGDSSGSGYSSSGGSSGYVNVAKPDFGATRSLTLPSSVKIKVNKVKVTAPAKAKTVKMKKTKAKL